MAQRVEAFGKILEFPDDMPHDAMAKAIRDNEHLLNPDYKPPEPEALDYAKVFAAGANRLVSGAGYLMEKAGAKSTGKAVRAFGDRGADYWNKTMSPGGKAASESQVFVDDEDSMLGVRLSDEWGKALMMGAAQSAPTMFAAAIPGALAAKGIQALARLGLAGGSGATIPLLAGTAAPVGVTSNIIARAPAAIGFGAAEGLTAGSMNAAALKTSMEEMPESEREKSPVYNALASIHGKDKAWELITDQATSDLFGKTAVSTGTIGALTGGGALGQAYQKAAGATKGGILKQSGKGVVSEFIQETPQSGAEKYIENIVKKEYLDPSIDPMDGVVSGALSGGAIGAFSGGIVGGAGAINVTKSREERILEEKRKLAKQKADAANKQKTQKDVGDIMGAGSVDEAINAASNSASQNPIHQDDVLRTEDPTLADIERLTGLKPTEAIDQAINEARNNVAESVPGSNSAPNYDISRKLNPRDTDIVLPDGTTLKAQWDVVDADSISASIKEGVNQPRDRTRAASDIQIQGIANNPDYRRLSDSPVMDVGAPVLSNDGLIVGGNGRFEGIAQAHSQGTVNDYLRTLKEDVINKGIDPSIVDTMKKPVLVRRITQPFDTRALAIASNSGTSLQYSGLELAKIDSERMKGIEDLDITDTGDIALTGENFQKLRQSLSDYNPSELAALTDNSGMLSQDGVRRIRNAMLAKAYGKSETLGRLVESTDSDMRNVLGALTKSSGSVAKARAHINAGGAPKQIDVTDNLLQAVETFGKIRAVNQPLDNYLAQQNIFNDGIDADSKEILQFLHNNVRSQKRLTEFIKSVYDQISTIDQKTDNLFGDNAPPTKRELIENAKQRAAGNTAERADNESGRPNEPKSGTQKDYAGSGQKSEPDTGGANFSRSPEERLKDRERSRQLEKALNRTYKFTITPRDVRLGATANGRGEEAATAERIAKIFRKRVTWIDAEGDFPINGVMVPGISDTIFIDTRTNKYAHAVIGHELSHHLEQDNPKAYRDMVIALMPIIKDAEAYRKKKDLDELSEATLIKEIVGDIMGDNFTDQKFWNKVAEHNPNAFRKIADSIITWLKRLVTNAKIRGLGSEQWVTDVEKAQDIVAKAVAQYTHAEPSEEGSKSEAKLSKRNTFEKAQGSLFEDNSNLVSQEELLRENYARSGDLFSDTEDSPDKDPGKQGGKIDDFGEKLGRARKDMATAMRKEYSDDDIAALPLSKIWPASEVDAIEDKYVAATAFAAREEIPVKPRVSYKVASWVQKVKSLRMLASFVLDGKITKENFKKRLKEFSYSLNQFAAKVDLLERIDRSDWKRIGAVAEYPDAYRYDSSGTKIPSPFVSVDIDGRYKQFHGGDGTIPSVIDEINALLSERQAEADQTKRMQFEVRGREGNLFINKKGDREYRKLKTFTSTKEAFNYIKDNYDELVEAWEAVKESDNVKKTDVRRDENRPRTGKDWREGKDVTPEQFDDEFGFKGVEFGNWVSQGGDNKERQGMLNQAYDALMDLSNIVGIPPKAISLNGSLGLGFGSRGKGWASAHFEPDILVINLTKTRGAGSLAHEWFHAMDNYFQRQRGTPSGADRKDYFVTYRPEPMMVHVSGRSYPMTREQLIKRRSQGVGGDFYKAENWIPDAKHPQGVRPEVERKFSDLVHVLDESPMKKRAEIIDKGKDDGYWSRIIERAARSFENYVIAKMMREGYQNDYLANVVSPEDFSRDKGRYPYLLESEIAPVEKAFDDLFGEIKYKQTDKGVALFSRADSIPETINIDGVGRPTRNSEAPTSDKSGAFVGLQQSGMQERAVRAVTGSPEPAQSGFEAGSDKHLSTLRPVDVFGNGSKIEYYDDTKGLMYSMQKYPVGERWTAWDVFPIGEGGNQMIGGSDVHKSFADVVASVRGARISAAALARNAKYGIIPNTWGGYAKKVAKALIDAGIGIDRFASSSQSTSKYIYLDNGKKIRLSDHYLPGDYDVPDFDFRYRGDVESLVNEILADHQKPDSDSDDIRFSKAGFSNDSTQTADAAADEGISPDRTKESDIPGETRFRKFQREWQDDFNRFTVLKEWLASRGINLSEKADVYLAEERFHARVANQQEDFRDFVANPLIQKIAEAGYKMTDIADFLEAQHAKEANDQIRRVHNTNDPDVTAYGVGDEEAAEYLANAPEELGKLANEFRAITESTKRIRLEGGLLNTDITGAWDATYKHYIPVKGIQDQPKGTGKRLSVNFKTKRRLGHGRRDEAVIENILHDHARAIFEVEKNRVAKHLVMMAAEIGMPELMTVGQPVKRKVLRNTTAYEVQVKGATVAVFDSREAAQTYKSSLPLIDKKVASDEIVINPTTDQRVIASASPMLADNEINAYIDGHAIRIQINDELAARAYKKLGVDGYGKLVAAGRALNGYLSKVYTGYNPEFIQVNIVRDFTTGIINLTGEEGLKMAAKAIKNYPGTFASLLRYSVSDRKKSTKWIDMYRATGGNTGAAYLSDMERLGNDVATEYAAYQGVLANLKEGKPVFAARAAGRKAFNIFLKWIYNLNQAGENAMRLAAFKAMIESGRTPNEAAHVAKNITVNFNRKGENGATANAAWLFFNASVQGQAAMSHALFKGKHKGQAWALATGMATLGYMVAAALGGGDEDDYDKIDDYTKERNLVINNGDGWLKIPVPYGYGFFYNIGRVMADAQRKDELGLIPWHITASAIEELSPFGDIVVGTDEQFKMDQVFMGILPTALKIPGQVAVNKQLFSGGEIMPDNPFDKSQPEREKMWRGTKGTVYDELAGRLQQIGLDVSPETLKYSFRTGTGGAGALVDSTVSAGMLKAGGAELDTAEIPFLRKIYHENTIKNDRAAFHKAREEAQTAAEEFARAIRKNDLVSAKKLSEDKGELIALDKYADQLQTVTKLWRDEQDRVRTDKSLTTGEKRLKLRELEAQESKLYDQYLDVFKVKKAEVKKKVDN
jgi:hypothetical protein